MATAKKPGTISYKNTPDKKYGGEDTLTAIQKVNRGIRDSFKGSAANKALNAKIKLTSKGNAGTKAVNAKIRQSVPKPSRGIGKPVSISPKKLLKVSPSISKSPRKERVRSVSPPAAMPTQGIGKPVSVYNGPVKKVPVQQKAPVRAKFPVAPPKPKPSPKPKASRNPGGGGKRYI